MTDRPPARNIGASVRQRLLNLTRTNGTSLETLLTRYALERLLYRLSVTQYANRFVLKGAMLVTSLLPNVHRQTRDIGPFGFSGFEPNAHLMALRDTCSVPPEKHISMRALQLLERNIFHGVIKRAERLGALLNGTEWR